MYYMYNEMTNKQFYPNTIEEAIYIAEKWMNKRPYKWELRFSMVNDDIRIFEYVRLPYQAWGYADIWIKNRESR